jgi:uncharacterized protein YkwD
MRPFRARVPLLAPTLVLTLLLAAAAVPAPTRAHPASQYCADAQEQAFLTLINDHRAGEGLAPLFFSHGLGAAADHHSIDVASNNLDVPRVDPHTGSDGSTVEQRMATHGYNYQGTNPWFTGENTTWGHSKASAQAAFDAWKASPGHNANMLKPEFKAIGIGRAFSANFDDGWFWTTTFGTFIDSEADACDTTPPRVARVVPAENATGVGVGANVVAVFSETIRAGTVNTNTVKLFRKGSTTPLAAAVSYDATAKKAILNPSASLARGATYKVVVTAGVRDLAGLRLDQDPAQAGNQAKSWTFKVRS